MMGCSQNRNVSSPIPIFIEADEARKLQNEPTVKFLDVGDPDEYLKCHIPGAHSANLIFKFLMMSDEQGMQEFIDTFVKEFQSFGINQNDLVIVYENTLNTRFGASCRGWYVFNLLGHKNVRVLNCGFAHWKALGFETTADPPQKVEKLGNFKPTLCKEIFVDKTEMIDIIQNKKPVVLLDVRAMDEWKAESSSPYGKDFTPRKGRLTGAIHINWEDFMETVDNQTKHKSTKDILELLEKNKITPDQDVVIYCFKGARASNTFIALRNAGFKKLRNYFASWNEWSRDLSLPIDDTVILDA